MILVGTNGDKLVNPGKAGVLENMDRLIHFSGFDEHRNPIENYATCFSQDGLCSITRWVDEHDRYWLSYSKQWIENRGYDFTREFPEIVVEAEYRELLVDLFLLLAEYGKTHKQELRLLIADAIIEIQDEGHDLWPSLFPIEAQQEKMRQEHEAAMNLPDSPIAELLQSAISESPEKARSTEMGQNDKTSESVVLPKIPNLIFDSPPLILESPEQSPTKTDQDSSLPCSGSPAPPTPNESIPWWLKTPDA